MPELVNNSDDEDDEPQAAYNRTKAMGDADREGRGYHTLLLVSQSWTDKYMQARKKTPKDDKTTDIKTIFTKDDTRVNHHTQEVESGWWCNVCR